MNCRVEKANGWIAGRAQAHAVVSDVIFKGFIVDMPSDASNCGDASQERPIFYCYYLIPGLNRFDALFSSLRFVDQLIAFWDWTSSLKAEMIRSTSETEFQERAN
ncbi:hypothetical protein [Caballeronia cordobensis]|uniref:hypothetical protein n=1 Tax=Caballeronia cordobensis TaxID=1353886 RepID=UPI001186AF4C